jgi:hypothetical protein
MNLNVASCGRMTIVASRGVLPFDPARPDFDDEA